MEAVLAFDLGTTGNRVLAYSSEGKILAKAYFEFTQNYPRPGWVEHDAEEIWQTTLQALRKVMEQLPGAKFAGAGITNQRETVVLWDKATGKPVHPAIVWQCRRTAEKCRSLSSQAALIKKKTGLPLDPYFSGTKIQWILDSNPDLRRAARGGDLLAGTIDTWIVWKLTGGKTHASEPSNLSRTLLFNIHELDYDSELLEVFDVPRQIMPQILESSGHFGTLDPSIHPGGVPITAVLGDQQASLFGQWGGELNVVKNTYGTGLFLMKPMKTPELTEDGLLTTIAWKQKGQTLYALEGSVFTGGAAIQWLRDGLKIISDAPSSEGIARSVPDNGGVYFVPALAGLGAPYWDPKARGTLIGITGGTQKEHVVRAVLEALAYQTKDVVDLMVKAGTGPLAALCVDGGASANEFLMDFQSNLLGMPVLRSRNLETTSLGVAGMAGIEAGFWSREKFFEISGERQRFEPGATSEEVQKNYPHWQRAVQRSLDWAAN